VWLAQVELAGPATPDSFVIGIDIMMCRSYTYDMFIALLVTSTVIMMAWLAMALTVIHPHGE
jgi:tetrahydromethanopterin S-methyltransferase subunit C